MIDTWIAPSRIVPVSQDERACAAAILDIALSPDSPLSYQMWTQQPLLSTILNSYAHLPGPRKEFKTGAAPVPRADVYRMAASSFSSMVGSQEILREYLLDAMCDPEKQATVRITQLGSSVRVWLPLNTDRHPHRPTGVLFDMTGAASGSRDGRPDEESLDHLRTLMAQIVALPGLSDPAIALLSYPEPVIHHLDLASYVWCGLTRTFDDPTADRELIMMAMLVAFLLLRGDPTAQADWPILVEWAIQQVNPRIEAIISAAKEREMYLPGPHQIPAYQDAAWLTDLHRVETVRTASTFLAMMCTHVTN